MKTRSLFESIVLIAAIMVSVNLGARADGTVDCMKISTDKGIVTGVLDQKENLCRYLGIPYAAPPVGELRFAKPVEHKAWNEPLMANKFGDMCVQNALSLVPNDNVVGSEDCLYLNITAPVLDGKELRPVMMFIHGGGFVYGGGSEGLYQGTGLVKIGGVVLVTVNYRLGPFGFLSHPALKDADGYEGNYGIHDQIAALKWIKKNIRNFGGDPGNVTVFGESAGGMSTALLLLVPEAQGLFKNAIIESGPVHFVDKDLKGSEKVGITAAEKLGCSNIADAAKCLRSLSAEQIHRGAPSGLFFMASEEASAKFPYAPCADGKLIPDIPYRMFNEGRFDKNVKVMLGSNSDEATYFIISRKLDTPGDFKKTLSSDMAMIKNAIGINVDPAKIEAFYPLDKYPSPRKAYNDLFTDMAFTCPTRLLADSLVKNGAKTYLYFFTKKPVEAGAFAEWGAFHGSELAFVFNKFEFMGIKFASASNSKAAKRISPLWSSFAATGVPSVEGAPAWPLYESKTAPFMRLNVDVAPDSGHKMDQCAYVSGVIADAFSKK